MGGTVRGDEKPDARDADAKAPRRVRTGPRHAAPKKSVLTRLQLPAGKAIALAAMPTAVLMGMGFTPQLANADPRADDHFKAGPCVSQSDEPAKDGKDDKGTTDKSSTDKGKDTGKDSADTGKDTGTPDPTPTPTSTTNPPADKDAPASTPGTDRTTTPKTSEPTQQAPEKSESTPSPTPTETTNPLDPLGLGDKLDPLGLGDKLKDVFGGGQQTQQPDTTQTQTPTPTPTGGTTTPDDSDPADPADPAGKDASDTAEDTTGKAGDTAKDRAEDTADTPKGGTGDKTGTAEDGADKATPKPGDSATPSEVEGYPCPTFDAEAYNNAKEDQTEALLPEDPWILYSSKLSLHGLDYAGIVEVRTHSGKIKKVLKFTASGIDIRDLRQEVVGPAGTTTHVDARKGSTSTIRNGTVTMYTEELSGNLLGLIPVTFTPKSPPPLSLPEMFFTKVKVVQAGQFGGDLTLPGMHVYKTGG
ncbi:hypothetical protein ACZ90_58105 [Streptomyces albus subsp. albus]|nr:hypothetical protein ACZ90_58105 [Streptomyces albus subsp. albus]